MKIGYVQFSPSLGDLPANRQSVERLVRQAEGADLLVLPELCSSGYHFRSREEAWAAAESASDGPFVRLLTGLSARHRVFLVAGLCEKAGDRLYNSAVAVGPQGVLGLYRKIHLFMNEKEIFTPGDLELPVCELALGELRPDGQGLTCRIGLLICFDWQFPEVWRVLALKGAEVVCHPSNLVLPGLAQRAVPLHALLNRFFVVMTNRSGTERGLAFTGRSLIASPLGEVLAEGPPEGEDVRLVEIDPALARNKWVTARNDLLADRRPEFYTEIVRGARPGAASPSTGDR